MGILIFHSVLVFLLLDCDGKCVGSLGDGNYKKGKLGWGIITGRF